MPYLTPLELCLEDSLERISMPFTNRLLIHEEAKESYDAIQSMSDEEIEKIAIPDYRARLRAKKKAPIDWKHHLVYRVTKTSPNGFDVMYSVYPSQKDVERFRRITDKKDYLPELERALRERAFSSEEVALRYNTLNEVITQELLDQSREELLHRGATKEKEPEEEDLYDERSERDVGIDFRRGKIDIFVGKDAPKDFFKGIRSPVKDAAELAKRITDYFQSLG